MNCSSGPRRSRGEKYIPEDGKFWVAKAASVKSKLFSPSDIQSIMKKAMVNRMKQHYHIDWFEENWGVLSGEGTFNERYRDGRNRHFGSFSS